MRLLVYNYYRKLNGWHPRQVDELELDEVEWLPVLEAASVEASEIIQKEIQAQSK